MPSSLVDIGCGEGYWLAEAANLGVREIRGLDGDYVRRDHLAIPLDCFIPTDLSKPFTLEKRFDLAMSLEVAEHLDASVAESFVSSLTKLAPAILFSAAIPGQGGTDHRNEQWPSYWSQLFSKHDFVCVDLLRPNIWQDQRIEVWYRQNVLLFVSKDHSLLTTSLKDWVVPEPADAVHAELYLRKIAALKHKLHWAENPGFRVATTQIRHAVKRLIAREKRK